MKNPLNSKNKTQFKIKHFITAITALVTGTFTITAQEFPKASVVKTVKSKKINIYTVVSPPKMFANTTHIIELQHELIVVDGQFFAPYAQEVKKLTDSLQKPIIRFYISHDHPDHYIGFGDAFPNVPVYALEETKAGIDKFGQQVLEEKQKQFGNIIAKNLNKPSHIQKTGKETIDGVDFIFEKSLDNEDAVSLVIKIPEAKTNIVQDIIFNQIHLFISGNTDGWRKAIKKEESQTQYTNILPGHGKPSDRTIFETNLKYLDFVNKALSESKSKEDYKAKLLAQYPDYNGNQLIDIYLAHYLKWDWKKK